VPAQYREPVWHLSRKLALATTATALAVLVAAPPAPSASAASGHPGRYGPARPLGDSSSINWAGYETVGAPGQFNHVEARWTQPTAACTPGQETYAIFWVGLDGAQLGDTNVEQTGTGVDCEDDGSVEYYVWYEMFPDGPVLYNDPIRPDDHVQAEVRALGGDVFELVLRDFTQKWTEITYAKPPSGTGAVRNSAEVVAESPGDGSLLLTDFGRVSFTDSLVDMRRIGSLNPDKVAMLARDGKGTRAVPSPLTNDKDFSVAWKDY
jgi:hypothetical protein